MLYEVSVNASAIKELAKINEPDYSRIKSALYNLANDPRPVGCKKLKGSDSYRIRIGNYRVIYDIFDRVLVVKVVAVGHRKDIYG